MYFMDLAETVWLLQNIQAYLQLHMIYSDCLKCVVNEPLHINWMECPKIDGMLPEGRSINIFFHKLNI